MSLSEKLMAQGGKPSGRLGRLIGRLMNLNHGRVYRWGLGYISTAPDSTILDVGCGGGEVVRLIATQVPKGNVYGVDHSLEMVRLSKRVNRSLIESGRVEISHGSVSSLPYSDEMFDAVTAFETIQFWPDLSGDLREVKRVLKPRGEFLVVNRYPGAEAQGSDWAEFLQIRTPGEYRDRVGDAGFAGISIDESSRPGWIVVLASKPPHG